MTTNRPDEQTMTAIRKAMVDAVADNRLTCADARAIAETFHVPYSLVGRLANDLKIKIRHCELGCF
ncbi:hypothetical protein GTO89_11385 [Heliobacterium gestii]|uniref:XRE family transcriptional regulator n=1 Tax=Heliomicrobium gestii TaxID=2699 RepID=A0A845LE50_HELGE|nr:hypothetical protein [Heliomicrobium gestii]MBM7867378.1 LAO/AO transport system kinase [Heliomicrobium gestii]MZP43644.1 hypothetical protein [Heliomicrobium gestii]